MRSKTLCFNGTLFRKNLSRYWPLWGLASFGGALFPLAMLVNLLHSGFDFWTPLETTQAYYNVLSYGVPVISIVYAVLCAMAVWNYLYNARSVGLMHTLPIRREGLFVTNVLSGLVMMAIPYAVTGVLIVLVSLLYGGFQLLGGCEDDLDVFDHRGGVEVVDVLRPGAAEGEAQGAERPDADAVALLQQGGDTVAYEVHRSLQFGGGHGGVACHGPGDGPGVEAVHGGGDGVPFSGFVSLVRIFFER